MRCLNRANPETAQLRRQNHIIVVVIEGVLVLGLGVKTIVSEGLLPVDVISYHRIIYLDRVDVELCKVNLLLMVVLSLWLMASFDEDALSNLPAVMRNANGTKVLVGPENVAQELKDTSVVMTKFDIGDGMQGMIGVVGPTRMDYATVAARLSGFAEGMTRLFGKQELPPKEEAEK